MTRTGRPARIARRSSRRLHPRFRSTATSTKCRGSTAPHIGELVQREPDNGQAPSQRTRGRSAPRRRQPLHRRHVLRLGARSDRRVADGARRRSGLRRSDHDSARHLPRSAKRLLLSDQRRRRARRRPGVRQRTVEQRLGRDLDRPRQAHDRRVVAPSSRFRSRASAFRPTSRPGGSTSPAIFLGGPRRIGGPGARLQVTQFFQVSEAGEITNLTAVSRRASAWTSGRSPAAAGCTARSTGDDDTSEKPGLDLFYNFTPSLKLSATVNTDFGETEVDARQINLSRFSILFPEKRAFFLENAGVFSFASIGTINPPPGVTRPAPRSTPSSAARLACSTARRCRWTSARSSPARSDDSTSAFSTCARGTPAPFPTRTCLSAASSAISSSSPTSAPSTPKGSRRSRRRAERLAPTCGWRRPTSWDAETSSQRLCGTQHQRRHRPAATSHGESRRSTRTTSTTRSFVLRDIPQNFKPALGLRPAAERPAAPRRASATTRGRRTSSASSRCSTISTTCSSRGSTTTRSRAAISMRRRSTGISSRATRSTRLTDVDVSYERLFAPIQDLSWRRDSRRRVHVHAGPPQRDDGRHGDKLSGSVNMSYGQYWSGYGETLQLSAHVPRGAALFGQRQLESDVRPPAAGPVRCTHPHVKRELHRDAVSGVLQSDSVSTTSRAISAGRAACGGRSSAPATSCSSCSRRDGFATARTTTGSRRRTAGCRQSFSTRCASDWNSDPEPRSPTSLP